MKKQRLLFLVQDVLLTLFVVSLVFGFSVNAAGNSRFDVNGDGIVSIGDVSALLIYLANPDEEPTPEPVYSKGLEYTLLPDGRSYAVSDIGSCAEVEIVVPPVHPQDGKPITAVGNNAFCNCANLISVKPPDSVTDIGESAFANCPRLKTFPTSPNLQTIGASAFFGCSRLANVTIPDSVISIGSETFKYCTSLTNVSIGNSVTSIGSETFKYCTSLTSVSIGNSVTSIGSSAFYDCDSLTSVTIPDSVTSIGHYAFFSCSKLTSVTFVNTSGWYRASSATATGGTAMNVTDPSSNAYNLRSNYNNYYWKRA